MGICSSVCYYQSVLLNPNRVPKIYATKIIHKYRHVVKVRLKRVNKKLKQHYALFIYIILCHEQKEIHRADTFNGLIPRWDHLGSGDLDWQCH